MKTTIRLLFSSLLLQLMAESTAAADKWILVIQPSSKICYVCKGTCDVLASDVVSEHPSLLAACQAAKAQGEIEDENKACGGYGPGTIRDCKAIGIKLKD